MVILGEKKLIFVDECLEFKTDLFFIADLTLHLDNVVIRYDNSRQMHREHYLWCSQLKKKITFSISHIPA